MKDPWFWIYKRKHFGGIVIGLFKIFQVWIIPSAIEITISELTWRPIRFWWKKIYFYWNPVDFEVHTQFRENGYIRLCELGKREIELRSI
jgi:hypothetical protein